MKSIEPGSYIVANVLRAQIKKGAVIVTKVRVGDHAEVPLETIAEFIENIPEGAVFILDQYNTFVHLSTFSDARRIMAEYTTRITCKLLAVPPEPINT